MEKSNFTFIFRSYLVWVLALLGIVFLSIKFLPLQINFLGGGVGNYLTNPFLWVWGNFDGEHYLSIAQNGYQPLTYFFFPLYPIAVKIFSGIFGSGLASYMKSGILVSNLAFLASIIGLYKLLKIDFKENIVRNTILFLLVFPTSFYFASVYTESLFLALVVWSIYFMRVKKWHWAGILGGLSAGTRIIGVVLLVVALIEYFEFRFPFKFNKKIGWNILWLLLIPAGLFAYMLFVWDKTGDPLNFFNSVSIFGNQRSNDLVILPQVFYRYIVKVLPNLNYSVFTSFFPSVLELFVGILFLGLTIISFWKVRLSYAVFLALGYLIPTLSGSFSSVPRYVLVLFPAFVVISLGLTRNKYLTFAFYLLSFILLIISLSFFARGYWIS